MLSTQGIYYIIFNYHALLLMHKTFLENQQACTRIVVEFTAAFDRLVSNTWHQNVKACDFFFPEACIK